LANNIHNTKIDYILKMLIVIRSQTTTCQKEKNAKYLKLLKLETPYFPSYLAAQTNGK